MILFRVRSGRRISTTRLIAARDVLPTVGGERFLRRDYIALHQRRRQTGDADVVETEARFVGGQQLRDVDIETQDSDRMVILGAGQAANRIGPPRIRPGGGLAIQGRLQIGHEVLVVGFAGPRSAGWRHRPRAEFPHGMFPELGIRGDVVQVGGVERNAARSGPLVVTANTVLSDS